MNGNPFNIFLSFLSSDNLKPQVQSFPNKNYYTRVIRFYLRVSHLFAYLRLLLSPSSAPEWGGSGSPEMFTPVYKFTRLTKQRKVQLTKFCASSISNLTSGYFHTQTKQQSENKTFRKYFKQLQCKRFYIKGIKV